MSRKVQRKLGERLVSLRERRGMAAKDVAEECELNATYISALENGRINPTLKNLVRIAEALDCTLATLLKGVDE